MQFRCGLMTVIINQLKTNNHEAKISSIPRIFAYYSNVFKLQTGTRINTR